MGSLLPFATLANRENRNKELSVSFRQFIQFILHLQRMAAIRRVFWNGANGPDVCTGCCSQMISDMFSEVAHMYPAC